jgi:hypothetical protein
MHDTERLLDPDGRYPACGLRTVDRLALRIHELLPLSRVERTRDVYQFTVEDPEGFIVIVTPDSVEFRLPTVEWTWGYAGPVASSRLLKRVNLLRGTALDDKKLGSLIRNAQRKRKAETITCAFCGKPTPPEHAHGTACHGCSEKHLGIVH